MNLHRNQHTLISLSIVKKPSQERDIDALMHGDFPLASFADIGNGNTSTFHRGYTEPRRIPNDTPSLGTYSIKRHDEQEVDSTPIKQKADCLDQDVVLISALLTLDHSSSLPLVA